MLKKKLPENLKNFIKKNKKVDLYKYIEFCLFNDLNGYYQKNNSIGKDFVTSPEISQIFGECIAFFLLYINELFSKDENKKIFELGPGNGTMINDILRIIQKHQKNYKNWEVILYEKSKKLSNIQKNKLTHHKSNGASISWTNKINVNPNGPIFFLCNEFFDALPIDQFKLENGELKLKKIYLKNSSKLSSLYTKTNKEIPKFYDKINNGDIIEVSNNLNKILKNVFKLLNKRNGVLVLFDYGPLNKKNIDTLQSINEKKKCGIFDAPCFSDITHHIDFQYIKSLAKKHNLECYGPMTQRKFLLTFGAKERFNILLKSTVNKNKHKEIIEGYNRIVSNSHMGELFKCIIFSSKSFILPKNLF